MIVPAPGRKSQSSQAHIAFPMKKINIPILMYHEVSNKVESKLSSYQMTPLFYISSDMFENQVKILAERGYKTVLFENIPYFDINENYIILTFDDGWVGNHKYALPILKRYGFKAVFFVAVELIGRSEMMGWRELSELAQHGMSIQSHAMTHRPLQKMDVEQIHKELFESKRCIENKLKSEVTAISFPHGSFDHRVVKIAKQIGYTVMCTSVMKNNYSTCLQNKPTILGRITMTNNISSDKFIKLIEYDKAEILKGRLIKGSKDTFKRIIGLENYGKLYRKFFNIKV